MPTLFESLQSKLNDQNELPLLAPQQDNVLAGLRAKTGKATTTSGPKASSIGEQSAVATAQGGLAQQRQAGALAASQLGAQVEAQNAKENTARNALASSERVAQNSLATQGQAASEQLAGQESMAVDKLQFDEKQRVEMLTVSADQQFRQLASEMAVNTDNIFREFERSNKELAYRKDAAQLEQVGFLMAMKDKSYMDELNRIGAERDLQDKMNYQEEMQRLVWGQELDLQMDQMKFKSKLNASQREWNEYLSRIDAEGALALAKATLADESRTQMISGVGNLAKAGIDAYYKSDEWQTRQDNEFQDLKESGEQVDYANDGSTAPVT
jgi:hypothetical protein